MYIFIFVTFRDVCIVVVHVKLYIITLTESPTKDMLNKGSTRNRGPMTKDVYENIWKFLKGNPDNEPCVDFATSTESFILIKDHMPIQNFHLVSVLPMRKYSTKS